MFPSGFAAALQAIKAWVDGQIASGGKLVGMAAAPYAVIWALQDGPYPGHPYATLQVVESPRTVGGKPQRILVDSGGGNRTERDEYDADMTVRVELFSRAPLGAASGLDETLALACGLEASLRTSAQNEAWKAADIAFVENRPPLSVPIVAGYGWERRIQLDVMFRVRVRVDVLLAPLLNDPAVAGSATGPGTVTGQVGG